MWLKQYLGDRYNRLEIIFFLFYYLLLPILSGMEFNLIEKGQLSLVLNEIPSRIISFSLSIIPAWICYKLLIQGYLFQKKYLKFIFGYLLYLVLLNFYTLYSNLLISKLPFLSASIIEDAARYYRAKVTVHFSVIYMIRELLVLSAIAYFIRAARQEKQISMLSKQQLQAELSNLKAQIQPHFFFNTLNNIYALSLQKSEKAAPLVAKHAEIMRYILYDSATPTVLLHKEIAFLKNYTAVEAVRYPDNISIELACQGITDTALIEPLLLLPFIENTFKHGISEEVNAGFITIIISLINNELSIEITNSKAIPQSLPNENGLGLKIAKKRLEMLYPGQHSLLIKDEEKMYTVALTVILRTV